MTDPGSPATVGWVAPAEKATRTTSPFRSAGRRARALLILLGMHVVVDVLTALHALQGKALMAGYREGTTTVAELDEFDIIFGLSGFAESVLFFVAAVVWLAWQSRTVDNVDAMGVGPSTYTPRWSIGWWFIPIANFFMPYRVIRDLERRYRVAAGAGLALVWWLLWLAMNSASNIAGRLWLRAEDYDAVQTGLTLWAIASGLTVVAALAAMLVVRRIQTAADVLAAEVAMAPRVVTEPEPTFDDDDVAIEEASTSIDADPPVAAGPATDPGLTRDQSSAPTS